MNHVNSIKAYVIVINYQNVSSGDGSDIEITKEDITKKVP